MELIQLSFFPYLLKFFDMNNSRRTFIKISALSASGLMLYNYGIKANATSLTANNKLADSAKALNRFPTYCEVCFWKCAAWAYVDENNNIPKIIGNDTDPHCYGRLCPRGTGGVGMYSDEDADGSSPAQAFAPKAAPMLPPPPMKLQNN